MLFQQALIIPNLYIKSNIIIRHFVSYEELLKKNRSRILLHERLKLF